MESATNLQNATQKLALLPNTSRHRRQMLSLLVISVAFLHHSTLTISHKLRSTQWHKICRMVSIRSRCGYPVN